jgi:hypothetical protein
LKAAGTQLLGFLTNSTEVIDCTDLSCTLSVYEVQAYRVFQVNMGVPPGRVYDSLLQSRYVCYAVATTCVFSAECPSQCANHHTAADCGRRTAPCTSTAIHSDPHSKTSKHRTNDFYIWFSIEANPKLLAVWSHSGFAQCGPPLMRTIARLLYRRGFPCPGKGACAKITIRQSDHGISRPPQRTTPC